MNEHTSCTDCAASRASVYAASASRRPMHTPRAARCGAQPALRRGHTRGGSAPCTPEVPRCARSISVRIRACTIGAPAVGQALFLPSFPPPFHGKRFWPYGSAPCSFLVQLAAPHTAPLRSAARGPAAPAALSRPCAPVGERYFLSRAGLRPLSAPAPPPLVAAVAGGQSPPADR